MKEVLNQLCGQMNEDQITLSYNSFLMHIFSEYFDNDIHRFVVDKNMMPEQEHLKDLYLKLSLDERKGMVVKQIREYVNDLASERSEQNPISKAASDTLACLWNALGTYNGWFAVDAAAPSEKDNELRDLKLLLYRTIIFDVIHQYTHQNFGRVPSFNSPLRASLKSHPVYFINTFNYMHEQLMGVDLIDANRQSRSERCNSPSNR